MQPPVAQGGSLPLPVLLTMAAPDISRLTGVLAGVSPGSAALLSHSSPQVAMLSLILWLTSTLRPFASQ